MQSDLLNETTSDEKKADSKHVFSKWETPELIWDHTLQSSRNTFGPNEDGPGFPQS